MNDKNELVPIEIQLPVVDDKSSNEMEADLAFAREKQIAIIDKSHEALDGIVNVARQSQHPRAFEVLAGYLKTQSELNKDLVSIVETKDRKRRMNGGDKEGISTITNQSIFVGSTAQLQEMLKAIKK